MLEALKKALGAKDASTPSQTINLAMDMSAATAVLDALRTEFEAYKATTDGVMAEAAKSVESLTADLVSALASSAQFKAVSEAAETRLAEMQATVAADKTNARKALLAASVGDVRAEALLAATSGIDDAAFSAVASALATTLDAEAVTGMFKEVGVAAKADATKVAEKSKEMLILEEKYSKK